jgi:terminal uridylyltransferase
VKVIEDLQDKLKKLGVMSNLVPITTAKVPILKFYHTPSELEGDISIYNTLGQQNTKLLRMYAEIDPRAKVCIYYNHSIVMCCEIGVSRIVSPGTCEFEH